VFKYLIVLMALVSTAFAGPTETINELTIRYIDGRARFFPVWATSMGINDYDSLFTDYSPESVFTYRNEIAIIMQELRQLDSLMLEGDDYINYQLLKSNIEYDDFILTKFPLHQISTALYIEEPLDGIYLLLLDNSRTMKEKAPFIIARTKAIGSFLAQRWQYQVDMAPIFFESAEAAVDGGIQLLEEAAQMVYKALPDSARSMSIYKNRAVGDYKTFKLYCRIEKDDASGTHVIGQQQLNYLLKNILFLNADADSLKKIGWYWYDRCNSAMSSLNNIIAAKGQSDKTAFNSSLTKKDILDYYQREINETAKFFKEKDVVTIPDDIGACIPVEMPEYMRAIRKGIAYQPPPPFSSDQTGYFYVRPIDDLDSAAIAKYSNMIKDHGFRGSVVHEAYPGHHLQLSLANRNQSLLRRIQDSRVFSEGWALYCEQMAIEQGLYGDDDLDVRWRDVYGGIRFRAIRIIVDCCLAEGSMTPDSALTFMNNTLGENTEYFKAEIRRYCANPTQALSYLTGKLIILDMLEKARAKEGNSFSLKQFHDKLLAEGSIPPNLIAEKLGYK